MAAGDTTTFVWRVESGEREILTFSVQDADGDTSPIPGWSVDAEIRRYPGGPLLYTFPTGDAELVGGGAGVRLTVPEDVSTAWTFTSGWYRVRVSDPASAPALNAQRVLQGTLIVDR